MINLLKTHPFFSDKQIDSCERLEHQGYCNENYLVVASGVKYIVRSFKQENINRKQEFYFQKIIYDLGIAPKPLVLDEKIGLMIMLFQEGEHKKNLSHTELQKLIATVKELHAYDIYVDDNITTALCRYELVKNPSKDVIDALHTIDAYPIDYVLSHNDLNIKNILWHKNKVIFLDFEYTAVNDCYFDLASISVEFNLSEIEDIAILDSYFGDEFYDEAKLDAYKIIYKALCEEWFQNNP